MVIAWEKYHVSQQHSFNDDLRMIFDSDKHDKLDSLPFQLLEFRIVLKGSEMSAILNCMDDMNLYINTASYQ